jgi:hypothetical protein
MIGPPVCLIDRPDPNAEGEMDSLSEILRTARLTGGVFLHGEFSEPWCLSSELKASYCRAFLGPADQMVLYHYLLEGCLTVIVSDGEAQVFLPGQAVVIPRNDSHHLHGTDPAARSFSA